MARDTLIAAAAIAVLGAGELSAQTPLCEHRIKNIEGEFSDVLGDRAYGPAHTVVRGLRNTALRLNTQRMEDACMETAEALEAALAAYRAAGPDETARIVPSPELGNIDERAVAFTDAGIDSSRIEGADVYSYDNDFLGEVDGVAMQAARPTHVVIGGGGFWDRGTRRAAIPVSMMRWDPEWEAFFVPITGEALQEAPEYQADAGAWSRQENDRYYEALIE